MTATTTVQAPMAASITTQDTFPLPSKVQLMPYNHEVYHTIKSSLREACQQFEARNAGPIVFTAVRECFLRNHVEDIFSACLIHRHFDLDPSERNVESGGKAIALSKLDGIQPSSWMFYHGKLYPYEYKLTKETLFQPPAAFVEDFGRTVQENGVEDLIGFQIYANGTVGLESTDHEARISTTVDVPESDPIPEGMAPASWAFFRE